MVVELSPDAGIPPVPIRGPRARFRDRSGQGLAEYALILALVGLVVLISLALLGGSVRDLWEEKVPCATPSGRQDAPGHGGSVPGQCRKAQGG